MNDDVLEIETMDEQSAVDDLNFVVAKAYKPSGKYERLYLMKVIWPGESWKSIKQKLDTGGSIWYVWYIDGVRNHIIHTFNVPESFVVKK